MLPLSQAGGLDRAGLVQCEAASHERRNASQEAGADKQPAWASERGPVERSPFHAGLRRRGARVSQAEIEALPDRARCAGTERADDRVSSAVASRGLLGQIVREPVYTVPASLRDLRPHGAPCPETGRRSRADDCHER